MIWSFKNPDIKDLNLVISREFTEIDLVDYSLTSGLLIDYYPVSSNFLFILSFFIINLYSLVLGYYQNLL